MSEVKKVGFMIYFMFTASQRLQHEGNSQGGGPSLKQNKGKILVQQGILGENGGVAGMWFIRSGQGPPRCPGYLKRLPNQLFLATPTPENRFFK